MESMRWVGVDVHAKESVAVVLDQATGEITAQRLAGRPDEVVEWLSTLEPPFRAVYEGGADWLWIGPKSSGTRPRRRRLRTRPHPEERD